MDKGWENIDGFKEIKVTLVDMTEDEIVIQKEKVKYLLCIIAASLTKHFSIWIRHSFIFLSVFSEQMIVTCILRYVLVMIYRRDELCVSDIHDRTIDMKQFRQYLIKYCTQQTIITVWSSPFFKEYWMPLIFVAMGYDI